MKPVLNKILCGLALFSLAQSLAMQPAKEVIEGDLLIVPNRLLYAKSLWRYDYLERQLNRKFNADDVLVHVEVISEESEDWENGHPRIPGGFPKCLLYNMLKGKKEGDTLNLNILNRSFVLHLTQLKHKHRYSEFPFHVQLESLKRNFLARPNFDLSALPKLLEEGTLVEDPTVDESEWRRIEHYKYKHGPNGFKDE